MSISKSTKAKRARKTRARRRAKAKMLCAIDFEVRGSMTALELGTRMHKEIERVMTISHYHLGDGHIGQPSEQLMAYASMVPGCEATLIMGGDLVHHKVKPNHDFDTSKAQEIINDFSRRMIDDPRRDPVTGRIRPVFNDEDEE